MLISQTGFQIDSMSPVQINLKTSSTCLVPNVSTSCLCIRSQQTAEKKSALVSSLLYSPLLRIWRWPLQIMALTKTCQWFCRKPYPFTLIQQQQMFINLLLFYWPEPQQPNEHIVRLLLMYRVGCTKHVLAIMLACSTPYWRQLAKNILQAMLCFSKVTSVN